MPNVPPKILAAYPSHYGPSHARKLFDRAVTPFGQAVIRFSSMWFGSAPPDALLGQTAGASLTDNTTEGVPNQPFHEIGCWQIPAGNASGPAPNPNPNAAYNAWGRLASNPKVRNALGRNATMEPNGWKTAPVDQAVVGLAYLFSERNAVNLELDRSITSIDVGSSWSVALAFLGFSAGARRAANHINPLVQELAAVPENKRWNEFVHVWAQGLKTGKYSGKGNKHQSTSYSIMRTMQKLASGAALLKLRLPLVNADDYFAQGTPEDEDLIVRSYFNLLPFIDGRIVNAGGRSTPSGNSGGGLILALLGLTTAYFSTR